MKIKKLAVINNNPDLTIDLSGLNELEAKQMWGRISDVQNILAETDPQKFPNTIPDKKLSLEEQMEFIGQIIMDLGMGTDADEAEHQIQYHADTLPESFRHAMKALNMIKNITCMSCEELESMGW